MAKLLRRNQVLNLGEGVIAALLLGTTFGHANSFDVSERVLYIVCCLSNAVCLRCDALSTTSRAFRDGTARPSRAHCRACCLHAQMAPLQLSFQVRLASQLLNLPSQRAHLMRRVASRHFSQVKSQRSDGMLTTIAGIQDLNILFSNVAFVAVLRAFVQVMEAGIKDPDLVVYLQVRPCPASAERHRFRHDCALSNIVARSMHVNEHERLYCLLGVCTYQSMLLESRLACRGSAASQSCCAP